MEEFKVVGVSQSSRFLRHRHVSSGLDDDFIERHLNDPNFDLTRAPPTLVSSAYLEDKKKYAFDDDIDGESQNFERYSMSRADSRNSTAIDFDDESPYAEVRAAVASIDDPTMPVNTFRMWAVGLIFSIFVSGLNQVLALRGIFITGIVIQLMSLPVGHGCARFLPTTRFKTFGYIWTLNPGPFTIKEHVCITVMANIVVGGAYSTDIPLVSRYTYGVKMSIGHQILLAISTQLIGVSFNAYLRRFVVWPSSMIWPGVLVNSALFNTLHKTYGKKDGNHMSRNRFFFIVLASSCLWYWLPGYLFTGLSIFNWICWIAPNNATVNALFGTNTGLGMSVLTFDWNMIAFVGSPLVTPWWSEMNTGVMFIIMYWIIAPVVYFTNSFNTSHFPISTSMLFDNTGARYNVLSIITGEKFDQAKYESYSPVFLSACFVLAYGIQFASFASLFVHTFLWFRKDIVRRCKVKVKDDQDVHSRLMQVYPDIPVWWFGGVFVVCLPMLLIAVGVFDSQLPIWAALVALSISAVLSGPLIMLQAITNQVMPTNVMHEFIAGYLVPGLPKGNMIFKTIGYISAVEASTFANALKLGHYMKIPPRIMFSIQVVSAVLGCVVVTFVQEWMFANVEDICQPTQASGYTCPGSNTFASSSVIWGGIGPRRLFSPGSIYSPMLWMFLVGALLPIPFYLFARAYPMSFWRYINIPVCFSGLSSMPPATGINYISWMLVGFIFNFIIRRIRFNWWMRYNYILSAGLDSGTILGTIIVFLAVQLPRNGFILNWWGNVVWTNTADANGVPLHPIPSGSTFGPSSWF